MLSLLLPLPAQAQETSVEVLHELTASSAKPRSALVLGADGSLYGTTSEGGAYSAGTIFKLDADRVLTTLHSFQGRDGEYPNVLIEGADVSLYGTTWRGGAYNHGMIFKLEGESVLTTLHSFQEADGERPNGLTAIEDGNFVGTTYAGGAYDAGTIFKLDADGVLTTLHAFTAEGGEGGIPYAGVTRGEDGSLYGTTEVGGAHNSGTVFKLDADGVLTTLHSFDVRNDGEFPRAGLTPDEGGSFYGTTWRGSPNLAGTVFKLDADGALTTVHRFNGRDGGLPFAALTPGEDGSFYGTTSCCGGHNAGTIFKLDAEGVLTTLHSFQMSDGARPLESLTRGADGTYFGTTVDGGLGYGVIFRLDVGTGGRKLPGDCNADGSRDLSDAVCLLGFLFLGAPQRLPCGSGLPGDGANLRLLDHNGDRAIDLSDPVSLLGFLFLGGPPPHAGHDCVAIPGCAETCRG